MSSAACVKCGRALSLVESASALPACARCRIRLRHAARDIEVAIDTIARLKDAGITDGRIVEELRALVERLLAMVGAESCRAR